MLTTEPTPSHTHVVLTTAGSPATAKSAPGGNFLADEVLTNAPNPQPSTYAGICRCKRPQSARLASGSIQSAGGSQAHDNMVPFACVNFILSLFGIFRRRRKARRAFVAGTRASIFGALPMSNPFLAEIRIFTGNFAPFGWALCNGQLMAISQNTRCSRCSAPSMGATANPPSVCRTCRAAHRCIRAGAGLSFHDLGGAGGETKVITQASEKAQHRHTLSASTKTGTTATSTNNQLALATAGGGKTSAANIVNAYSTGTANTQLNALGMSIAGNGQPHNNMMPYLGLTFIIALQGVFPARS